MATLAAIWDAIANRQAESGEAVFHPACFGGLARRVFFDLNSNQGAFDALGGAKSSFAAADACKRRRGRRLECAFLSFPQSQ
jgi:hypothetical protein